MKFIFSFLILSFSLLITCNSTIYPRKTNRTKAPNSVKLEEAKIQQFTYDTTYKTIHVYVALCDNKYQGIVPVPKAIGNGQDPNNNLYWGCGFGIRTYFKKSAEWKFIQSKQIDSTLLERVVFKHASKKYYLVADAYNGKYIETCMRDFFESTSGNVKDTLKLADKTIGIAGNSSLCAYIGHNGLMDFRIDEQYENKDGLTRNTIILACLSQKYYQYHMKQSKVNPLVWTTNFMAPEAYTLHDALSGYILGETNEQIRSRAALAYSKYQKCSVGAARRLLVTGWF